MIVIISHRAGSTGDALFLHMMGFTFEPVTWLFAVHPSFYLDFSVSMAI